MHDPLTELRRKGFDIGMTVGNKLVPGKNEMMTNVFTVHSAYVDSGAEGFRVVALMPVLALAASSSAAPPPFERHALEAVLDRLRGRDYPGHTGPTPRLAFQGSLGFGHVPRALIQGIRPGCFVTRGTFAL